MKDELKKLGLRIRPRTVKPREEKAPGQVAFDDRGNGAGEEGARRDAQPPLKMLEDEPHTNAPIRQNREGMRVGYNPYESGLLSRKAPPKKPDLHKLSKWLEMKRKLDKGPTED